MNLITVNCPKTLVPTGELKRTAATTGERSFSFDIPTATPQEDGKTEVISVRVHFSDMRKKAVVLTVNRELVGSTSTGFTTRSTMLIFDSVPSVVIEEMPRYNAKRLAFIAGGITETDIFAQQVNALCNKLGITIEGRPLPVSAAVA